MKTPNISFLFCVAVTAVALDAMERPPLNTEISALSRLIIQIDHPVSIPGIAHYSLFRNHSVSTFIHNESDLLPDANCYVTRTISCYPKEEIREVFCGTQELPVYKVSRAKTGLFTYEDKIELIALQSSLLKQQTAHYLFKKYVFDYKLFDQPVEAWLDEISKSHWSSKPITRSDSRAPVVKTNTQCNILG